jgi:hypothetical protein
VTVYINIGQGCQIFLDTTYQNEKKYTNLPQNIPNVHKIHQMAIKYTNILQEPPKFTQNCIFGLKICHLATLILINIAFKTFSIFEANSFGATQSRDCFPHGLPRKSS